MNTHGKAQTVPKAQSQPIIGTMQTTAPSRMQGLHLPQRLHQVQILKRVEMSPVFSASSKMHEMEGFSGSRSGALSTKGTITQQ